MENPERKLCLIRQLRSSVKCEVPTPTPEDVVRAMESPTETLCKAGSCAVRGADIEAYFITASGDVHAQDEIDRRAGPACLITEERLVADLQTEMLVLENTPDDPDLQ